MVCAYSFNEDKLVLLYGRSMQVDSICYSNLSNNIRQKFFHRVKHFFVFRTPLTYVILATVHLFVQSQSKKEYLKLLAYNTRIQRYFILLITHCHLKLHIDMIFLGQTRNQTNYKKKNGTASTKANML